MPQIKKDYNYRKSFPPLNPSHNDTKKLLGHTRKIPITRNKSYKHAPHNNYNTHQTQYLISHIFIITIIGRIKIFPLSPLLINSTRFIDLPTDNTIDHHHNNYKHPFPPPPKNKIQKLATLNPKAPNTKLQT